MKTYEAFKQEVLGRAYDVDGYYGAQCPAEGTLILTEDCQYVPVETLTPGDILYGGNKVLSNEPKKSPALCVRTAMGELFVSEDHRFVLSDGSLKMAKDFVEGDSLLWLAINEQLQSKLPESIKPFRDQFRRLDNGDYMIRSWNKALLLFFQAYWISLGSLLVCELIQIQIQTIHYKPARARKQNVPLKKFLQLENKLFMF